MSKLNFLKVLLYLGVVYYVMGAVVHYFGFTLFPWFDGKLYAPYQDTVIAFVALVFAYLLIVVAKNPIKNKEVLRFIVISATLASILSILIIWKVDFVALGAPAKKFQTIVEGILGFLWVGAVLYAYPHKEI